MAKSHQFERNHITEVSTGYLTGKRSNTEVSRRGPGGATRQAAVLRREGVVVGSGHLGELTVDFGTYGWFPSLLPSEEAESSESEDEASE